MQDTSIAWADWTWNPIRGCSRISPGCVNCYAEQDMARKNTNPKVPGCHGFAEFRIVGGKREAHWTGKVELIESKLLEPLSWRRKAVKFREQHGRKPRAFISMSDLFHEVLTDEAIDRVFAVMGAVPEVNWMVLTKRADRMSAYGRSRQWVADGFGEDSQEQYLPNVALGVSVELPKYMDRVLQLQRTPAAMKFISYEPALESINWEYPESIWPKGPQMCCPGPSMECGCMGLPVDPPLIHGINMIIVGGESGPGARPFNLAWARSTVKQCRAAGVAPFVKQMGSNHLDTGFPPCVYYPRFKDRKGEDMSEWPEDVRVREWPKGWN